MRGTGAIFFAGILGLASMDDGEAQSSRMLSFGNRTCGPITLTFEGEAPCEAYSTGCRLPLATGQTRDIDLENGESYSLIELKIEGRCPGQPSTTIAGRCTLDLGQMFPFRASSNFSDWPSPKSGFASGADVVDGPHGFAGAFPPSPPDDTSAAPAAAAIDVDLADCESSGDGATQVCAASCRSGAR